MHDESEKPHALVCTEVWGGNRKISRTVKLPSLMAWVASHPIDDGEGGGDLHYMSVCDYDFVSRVALADVSGHGHDVSAVTQTLHQLMHKNINLWDQAEFMRGLNDTFNKSKKYATAIVLSFHRVTGRLAFSNAGHPPPLWYHAAQRRAPENVNKPIQRGHRHIWHDAGVLSGPFSVRYLSPLLTI